MKAGPLIAFLVLGGAAIYILWKMKGSTASTSPRSTITANGYTTPDVSGASPTGGYDHLQAQIDALSKTIATPGTLTGTAAGTAVGSTTGAAAGSAISSAEQAAARTLGAGTLTDPQIIALANNASSTGLAGGSTSAAIVSSTAGGAVGTGIFDLIDSFLKGAAGTNFLRPGGTADRLNIPRAAPLLSTP